MEPQPQDSIQQMESQPQDSIQQMEPQLQESKKPNNKRSDSAAADAAGSKVQTLQVKEKLWSSLKYINLEIYQAHTAIFFWIGCLLCAINCLTLLLGPWSLILMFSWSLGLAIHALMVCKNDGDNEHYDYQFQKLILGVSNFVYDIANSSSNFFDEVTFNAYRNNTAAPEPTKSKRWTCDEIKLLHAWVDRNGSFKRKTNPNELRDFGLPADVERCRGKWKSESKKQKTQD